MNQTVGNTGAPPDDEVTLTAPPHSDTSDATAAEQPQSAPLTGNSRADVLSRATQAMAHHSWSLPLVIVAVLAAGALAGAAIGIYRTPQPPTQTSSDQTFAENAKTSKPVVSSASERPVTDDAQRNVAPNAVVTDDAGRERQAAAFSARRMRRQVRAEGNGILRTLLRRVIIEGAPSDRGRHGKHKHDDEGDDH